MTPEVRAAIAGAIAEAEGREVSFVAAVDEDGILIDVRPVARGTVRSVLALPGVAQRGEMLVHNHPSGHLEPSPADLSVAAQLHDGGVGFAIVDNAAESLYVVVEVPTARPYTPLDPLEVAGLLAADSPLASGLGQFEDRPSQRDMAAYIADVYNEGGVSILEAGTGVGKSFAYLIPALRWAEANEERTIVSTNTINLQEQLIGKDLPALATAVARDGYRPTFALLKGWRNYLCRARLEVAQGGQGVLFDEGHAEELATITEWAARTGDGSLSDLPDTPTPDIWDEVCCEPDLCTRLECGYFENCFLFEARRAAAEADIVVVNHHLLAADLAVRRNTENWTDAAVLPPYRRLILDEAHHLEDVAAQHLGHRVASTGVARLLSRMERKGKGLIPTLLRDLSARGDLTSQSSMELLRTDVLPEVQTAKDLAVRLFGLLATLVSEQEPVRRLTDGFVDDPVWEELGGALDDFVRIVRRLRDGVEVVTDRLELDEDLDHPSPLLRELRGAVRRLEAIQDGLLITLRPRAGLPTVRWVERRGKRAAGGLPFPVAVATVPLDLAPILKDNLFDRIESVVLTSATLATGGHFGFLKGRVGLSIAPSRLRDEEILPSPFAFGDQCLLGLPSDLPDPRQSQTEHESAVIDAVVQLAHLSDGGMFVLFTSHGALRRAASQLHHRIGSRWPILVQGERQRDVLLRRFREAGSAILLGTDSFWEGVDVPGRALRAMVIAKLPFKVPTEPITAARLERLAEQGTDGFTGYLVPHAALKLKQGFGRLIRKQSDFGVVALMDPRVTGRPYGRVLLESLPPARRVEGRWNDIRMAVEEFFAERGTEVVR